MTVVLVRSYSRNFGETSEEIETEMLGARCGDPVADAPLVLGPRIGVQQRDRNRLAPGCQHGVDGPFDRRLVQRRHHRAVGPHALDRPRRYAAAARAARDLSMYRS